MAQENNQANNNEAEAARDITNLRNQSEANAIIDGIIDDMGASLACDISEYVQQYAKAIPRPAMSSYLVARAIATRAGCAISEKLHRSSAAVLHESFLLGRGGPMRLHGDVQQYNPAQNTISSLHGGKAQNAPWNGPRSLRLGHKTEQHELVESIKSPLLHSLTAPIIALFVNRHWGTDSGMSRSEREESFIRYIAQEVKKGSPDKEVSDEELAIYRHFYVTAEHGLRQTHGQETSDVFLDIITNPRHLWSSNGNKTDAAHRKEGPIYQLYAHTFDYNKKNKKSAYVLTEAEAKTTARNIAIASLAALHEHDRIAQEGAGIILDGDRYSTIDCADIIKDGDISKQISLAWKEHISKDSDSQKAARLLAEVVSKAITRNILKRLKADLRNSYPYLNKEQLDLLVAMPLQAEGVDSIESIISKAVSASTQECSAELHQVVDASYKGGYSAAKGNSSALEGDSGLSSLNSIEKLFYKIVGLAFKLASKTLHERFAKHVGEKSATRTLQTVLKPSNLARAMSETGENEGVNTNGGGVNKTPVTNRKANATEPNAADQVNGDKAGPSNAPEPRTEDQDIYKAGPSYTERLPLGKLGETISRAAKSRTNNEL